MRQIVVLNDTDNVATSLVPLEAQSRVEVELNGESRTITVLDAIPFGHKLAIRPLAAGDDMLKYGEVIGRASEAIEPGRWVHVHNAIGAPVAPTVKVTGNPNTARAMGENIDVDVSAVLTGEEGLDAAGERVWRRVVKVASGALTSCEVLNEQQLSVSRFGPSV